jgi:hypothetical protein
MQRLFKAPFILITQLAFIQLSWAYLQPVAGYGDEGSLYLETDSIVRNGPTVTLTFVENFNQARDYGSSYYLSKATDIRLDCANSRLFALAERFYSEANLQGSMLEAFPLYDQFGSTPVGGSWDANLLNLGCASRRY